MRKVILFCMSENVSALAYRLLLKHFHSFKKVNLPKYNIQFFLRKKKCEKSQYWLNQWQCVKWRNVFVVRKVALHTQLTTTNYYELVQKSTILRTKISVQIWTLRTVIEIIFKKILNLSLNLIQNDHNFFTFILR